MMCPEQAGFLFKSMESDGCHQTSVPQSLKHYWQFHLEAIIPASMFFQGCEFANIDHDLNHLSFIQLTRRHSCFPPSPTDPFCSIAVSED